MHFLCDFVDSICVYGFTTTICSRQTLFGSGVGVGYSSSDYIQNVGVGSKGSENRRDGFEGNKEFSFVFDSLGMEFYDSGMENENTGKGGTGIISSAEQRSASQIGDCGDFGNVRMSGSSSCVKIFEEDIASMETISGGGIDILEHEKERGQRSGFASLELLKNYGSGFKRLHREVISQPSLVPPCRKVVREDLSTAEIFRVAGEMFIQSSSQGVSDRSVGSHLTDLHFCSISEEQIKDVQLAMSIFLAAEGVAFQQFERATRLLNHCDMLVAQDGSTVQRVVYYFSEALRERIDRISGNCSLKGLGKLQDFNIEEAMIMSPNPFCLSFHRQTPFSQACQFAAVQSILENVGHAKKVHVIDFGIKCGVQWTILMQALATRGALTLELLKITAVSTASKQSVEDTGSRLANFAHSLNLTFAFSIVMVDDMLNLHEDLIELEDDEVAAIYVPFVLRAFLSKPDRLEHMMSVIRSIQPCMIVMIEVEADHNSPAFANRFTEALFYFSSYFDCLATCMGDSNPNRKIIESVYFSQGIRNIIATEGAARTVRSVKIEVWRAFFTRFQLVEAELSSSSLYQARLILKEFNCGSCCTLEMHGKSFILEWNGTPIMSLSAWKFT
uniref:Uncharacterized protein n=1 Tax=Kalanchoe fedtschenkoi TaxID=63787 RepID=A0A7N0UFL6_KALFE